MFSEKKLVYLSGILSTVKIGERAAIKHCGVLIRTSPVVSILAVTPDYVKFETRNSVYAVSPETEYTQAAPVQRLYA